MNLQTHRLVFNKARCCLMAVGEHAHSGGGGGCSGARRSKRRCSTATLGTLAGQMLTGQRFLGDYTSDEQQYQALMNAGVQYAQQMNLRPGIALSAEQMSRLTADMVWLVNQTVTLADGSQQTVLVPQVYARLREGDVSGNGALMSGRQVDLAAGSALNNSGTLSARTRLSVSAQDIRNSGSVSAQSVDMAATQDLQNIGGLIRAQSSLSLSAGRDLSVASTTHTQTQAGNSAGASRAESRTQLQGIGQVMLTGDGSGQAGQLSLSAGRDVTLTAAAVASAGSLSLNAGRDVNLQTLTQSHSQDTTYDANRYLRTSQSQEVGTQISAVGELNLKAGQDVNARAANVQAQVGLLVDAGRNVNISAGEQSLSTAQSTRTNSSGLFSSSSTTSRNSSASTTAVGSSFEGQSVNISAGQDLNVKGSNVLADQNVNLSAGGNVNIEAAQNTQNQGSFSQTTKSGLLSGGGLSVTLGKQMQSVDSQGQSTTAAGSTIGSTGGNVSITAGKTYTQTGSDILTPGLNSPSGSGNIDITAKTVDIKEARETGSQSTEQKFKQSGLTVAITSPVISALQTANNQLQAAGNTSSGRMQALAAANAGFNLKQGADAVQAGQGDANGMVKNADGKMVEGNAADKAGGIGISLSLGASSSQSQQQSSADSARGSSINAGGNVSIQATRTAGAPNDTGKDSDITVQGSNVQAAKTVTLKADDQVNLLAAQNTTSESNSNQSKSGSIGVAMQLGAGGGGMGFTASASKATGQGAGNSTTYTNSQVAGNTVNIQSGGDTNLKGAVVRGDQVMAKVGNNPFGSGGNLNIESLQDKSQYKESSKSAGGSVMVGAGYSGSINLAKSSINSDYLSVGEQSAIRAGDGGFQVNVQGNTTLTGAQITSTQAAVDQNKNSYEAKEGTTTTDLSNSASFSANSVGVGVGTGSLPGQGSKLSSAGFGTDSGNASSTTTAGISGVAGNTAARTGDKSTSIAPIFNKDQVKAEVNAQVAITSEFGKQAIPLAAKTADDKAIELRRQGNEEEAKKWDEGGVYRTTLYTALGGLTGGAAGATGAAVNSTVIPTLGEEIAKLNLPEGVRQVATQVVSVAVGATAGGAAGVSTALPQTAYNYVSHSPFANVRKTISQENARLMNQCGANCTEQDFKRIDQQMAKLEVAGNLAAISQNSKLTTEQALQLGETVAALLPVYGTPIALYQAISGKSLSGQDLSTVERFFNGAAAAIPAGSTAYKLVTDAAVQAKVAATLTATAERALVNSGGVVDKTGNALLDMSKLTNEQKRVIGENLFGPNTVKQIVPDGQQIARMQGQGSNGIDELYKVNRPDVDYVNIEYKFVGQDNKTGAQVLKNTNDGKQGSTSWIGGSGRIEDAVGADNAIDVDKALRTGRVESWVVTVRPDGSTAVQVLDALGKPKPIDQSKIILPNLNLTGAKP
ncbi:hemagglutinin repeat-containing protein [Limnohabitans sp. DM1]|uniref:hemagglutinin repeat-containing protein n=1 Tax=Limnohabitans sp. DM1 TaxID=1597955 RepID=UPI000B111A1A|nr:hemagglutinin repeat-containing protein [Limnohabitans sp. DM1]